MDWIDQQLYDLERKSEQIPESHLRGFVQNSLHTLRWVYEIWRLPPVNAVPVKYHAEVLRDLYRQFDPLMMEFNENLARLHQTWSGPQAEAYLGPTPTAFQIEHDMEPPNTSASMQLWANMSQMLAGLDYNAAAHHQSGVYLDNMNTLHGQLDWNFKLALADMATMVGTAFIPGVDLVTDTGATEGIEAYEVGRAAETAEEIVQTEEAVRTTSAVEQAERIAEQAWQAWTVRQMLRYIGIGAVIVTAGAGLTVVVMLFARNRSVPPQAVHPEPTPIPNINYPPNIAGNPQKEALYKLLYLKYSDAFKAAYEAMIEDGYTSQQCEDLITKFGLDRLNALASDPNKQDAIQYLYTLKDVSGIDKVIDSLIVQTYNVNKIAGDLFELEWMNAHAGNIVEVQLPAIGIDNKEKQGPDALLKDGSLIQLKTYQWDISFYNIPFGRERVIEDLDSQVEVTSRNYKGEPIVFVFNSRFGDIPSWAVNALKDLAVKYNVPIKEEKWP